MKESFDISTILFFNKKKKNEINPKKLLDFKKNFR
jgi:hypothetical protein